jgi:predicted nucleic acid-binding protein
LTIVDTSLLIERISEGKPIDEKVSMISVIEHPMVLDYSLFHGKVLYPDLRDFELAVELQRKLRAKGMMKGSSDLIIAASCINNHERLLTLDRDFEEISKISGLKVTYQ